MEVHAHTHTSRKKWTHYFWEFLMLFLAVTLGFFVENQREHYIEHQREKQYIRTLIEDLRSDTAQLATSITERMQKENMIDSLVFFLNSPEASKQGSSIYYWGYSVLRPSRFIQNDRTIQQLKNGGGMRLIRNKAVSNSIVDYDSKVKTLAIGEAQMNKLVLTFGLEKNKLFQNRLLDTLNSGFHDPPIALLSQNKNEVEEFYNNMKDQRTIFSYIKRNDKDLLETGTRTIEFIKKEYHLE